MVKALALGVAVIALLVITAYALSPRKHTTSNDPLILQLQKNFGKIKPEYARIPIQTGSSSYTENKETITLCIKDPETNKNYDLNTISYVFAHELAHLTNKTYGHGPEWRANFDALLKAAAKAGIYDPNSPMPAKYCGVTS